MKKWPLVALFLAGSILFWVLLRVSRSPHQNKHETSEARGQDYGVTGDYTNMTTALSGLNLSDARLGEDLLDASHATADPPSLELEPPTVVAIISVTKHSLPDVVSRVLPHFLPLAGLLQEVILLCPDELSPAVRNRLRDALPDDGSAHMEISVFTWLNGLEEGSALLYAARQVYADRVVVFDSDSVTTVSDDILNMLVAPLMTPLPIGPRGFSITGDRVSCIEAGDEPQAAAFLVPPFSVATILVPPHDLSPDPVYDIWRVLGYHIARARFEGVGGVAVNRGVANWCSAVQHRPATSLDAGRGVQPTIKPHDGASEDSSRPLQDSACSPAKLSVFVFAFKSEQQLRSFAPVVCRLQHEGHMAHIATIAARADSAQTTRPKFIDIFDCAIEFTEVHWTGLQLDNWLATLSCSPAAVVTSELDPPISAALARLVAEKYGPNITLVSLPDGDVPYCDWMGSLTAEEWRSESNFSPARVSHIPHDRRTSQIGTSRNLRSA